MPRWVVNASPLILLGKVDRLFLLERPSEAFVIPEPVAEEIRRGPMDDPARRWVITSARHRVRPVGAFEPKVAAWDLGYGEGAVLTWALRNPGWVAVIDDLAARKCAYALGIPFTGTLGVILAAKRLELIPEVRAVLDELERAGMSLADEVKARALRMVGEA